MKSAYELALEKLQRQDAERGETQPLLTPDQREEIAAIRKLYQSKLVERQILHEADLRKARGKGDQDEIRTLEEGYQRERARLEAEMEAKILQVRRQGGIP